MRTWEMLRKAMNEGLPIRRKEHKPGHYYEYWANLNCWANENGEIVFPCFDDQDIWELCSKPKVKRWKWLLESEGDYFETTFFYKSEDQIRTAYKKNAIIGKIEHSMIETDD